MHATIRNSICGALAGAALCLAGGSAEAFRLCTHVGAGVICPPGVGAGANSQAFVPGGVQFPGGVVVPEQQLQPFTAGPFQGVTANPAPQPPGGTSPPPDLFDDIVATMAFFEFMDSGQIGTTVETKDPDGTVTRETHTLDPTTGEPVRIIETHHPDGSVTTETSDPNGRTSTVTHKGPDGRPVQPTAPGATPPPPAPTPPQTGQTTPTPTTPTAPQTGQTPTAPPTGSTPPGPQPGQMTFEQLAADKARYERILADPNASADQKKAAQDKLNVINMFTGLGQQEANVAPPPRAR